MATRTVVCPECDSPLSPGRFACSVCGALVAAVASAARPFLPPEPAEPAAAGLQASLELPPAPPAPVATAPVAVEEPAPARRTRPVAPARRPKAPAPVPATPVQAEEPEADVQTEQPAVAWVLDQPQPARPTTPPAVPTWPDHPAWPPQRSVDSVAPLVEPEVVRVPAGSYLPPSAVLPPGEALPLPDPARAEASGPIDAQSGPDRSLTGAFKLQLGEGTGPLGMPADAATRVVILGAGIAALGFLLPWADIVIGSGSIGGYLEQWGLAGPGHVIVLALVVGLAATALVAERLPRWVRLGLPSIALACLLTGLIWPYLVGPFDASIGVYVVAVGAIVMIAGGLLDRIVTRHAEPLAGV